MPHILLMTVLVATASTAVFMAVTVVMLVCLVRGLVLVLVIVLVAVFVVVRVPMRHSHAAQTPAHNKIECADRRPATAPIRSILKKVQRCVHACRFASVSCLSRVWRVAPGERACGNLSLPLCDGL